MRIFQGIILFICCTLSTAGYTQVDSVKTDTGSVSYSNIRKAADTVNGFFKQDSILPQASEVITRPIMRYNAKVLPLDTAAVYRVMEYRWNNNSVSYFYPATLLLFFIGFLHVFFPRYFKNLSAIFFQTTLRQRQTRDQLLQNILASLLLNLFFVISVSFFIAGVAVYRNWTTMEFWEIGLYTALFLAVIYFSKYLFLKFTGWVFNEKEPTDQYGFIVFLVNKIIGILLIPFLLIVLFAADGLKDAAIIGAVVLVAGLFGYRYIISFLSIQRMLKINAFHFLLYLCAVEILPLMLLYRFLDDYITGRF